MAKVRIFKPSSNYVTILKGKRADLIKFLSDVVHSMAPAVSRGMLPTDHPMILALPDNITDCRADRDDGRPVSMNWYGDELPSIKAERKRLVKKAFDKKQAAK